LKNPEVHLAYAPRGAGLECALFYLRYDPHVSGWWIGSRGAETVAAYFLLENFYSPGNYALFASNGSDLGGGWRWDLKPSGAVEIDPLPMDSAMARELQQVQGMFASEWLSFPETARAAQDERSYREAELAHGEVNVRFERLNKLDKESAVWTYYSRGFESGVLKLLQRRWPLDYGKD
jgi:hypothetical protein